MRLSVARWTARLRRPPAPLKAQFTMLISSSCKVYERDRLRSSHFVSRAWQIWWLWGRERITCMAGQVRPAGIFLQQETLGRASLAEGAGCLLAFSGVPLVLSVSGRATPEQFWRIAFSPYARCGQDQLPTYKLDTIAGRCAGKSDWTNARDSIALVLQQLLDRTIGSHTTPIFSAHITTTTVPA